MNLPSHVRLRAADSQRITPDALFYPSVYFFPELREHLWPVREFPIPFGANADPNESALEAQMMGLQYSLHVQMKRDPNLVLDWPSSWDKKQLLWTDLPVFTEEPCEWHYPVVRSGYNTSHIEPPSMMRPDLNTPQYLGYLPNGDIAVYWEIAEALAAEFDIDIQSLESSVDGRTFVAALDCDEERVLETPVGQGAEVGIILAKSEESELGDAIGYIEAIGGAARVFKSSPTMFYRLDLPVMQCEWGMNPYTNAHWDFLSFDCPRLSGYDFRINDSPAHRHLELFSTENGNVVVGDAIFERIRSLVSKLGGVSPGQAMPVIRTP